MTNQRRGKLCILQSQCIQSIIIKITTNQRRGNPSILHSHCMKSIIINITTNQNVAL